MCVVGFPRCDLIINSGVPVLEHLYQSFGDPRESVRKKSIETFKQMAPSFTPEQFEQAAKDLGQINDSQAARDSAKDCMVFLSRPYPERRPAQPKDDTSILARPLSPEEIPED